MADDKTFQAPAFSAAGESRDRVTLPAELFDGSVHLPAMHQAVKAYLANQRQGTAATKTRGFVAGGNQKPWKQKGTGRARQGSIRAPHFVGGGTVFGPQPRSYAQYVPRQVRALARKSALNARARENAIVLIDAFRFAGPKTQEMKSLIEAVGGAGKKVLVLTNGAQPNVFLSGRNLPLVHVMPYSDVSTYHILWSELVVIEESALTGEPRAASAGEDRDEALSGRAPAARRSPSRAAAGKGAPKGAGKTKASAKAKKEAPRAAKRPAAKKAAKKKGK